MTLLCGKEDHRTPGLRLADSHLRGRNCRELMYLVFPMLVNIPTWFEPRFPIKKIVREMLHRAPWRGICLRVLRWGDRGADLLGQRRGRLFDSHLLIVPERAKMITIPGSERWFSLGSLKRSRWSIVHPAMDLLAFF